MTTKKAYEYQKQIFYNEPNRGRQLKSYAETKKYADKVNEGIKFKNEVLEYFQSKNDLAHLTQFFIYEGEYQKALEIAKKIQLDKYSGDYYNPVMVCAYFFTYAALKDEESLKLNKNISNLFKKMKTTISANTPYLPLMESVEGKSFSNDQKELFLLEAINFYKKIFNHIVISKYRDQYDTAATYCGILKEIYAYLGKSDEFNRYYANLLETYHRFRALIPELKKII
jgi:hypothetical protein